MNTDKKEQKEKDIKQVKKSSYSKKKKIKKNILNGKAFVLSTFNNTIISISDTSGNVVSWSSAGQKGFKGSRKSTPYAAQVAAEEAVQGEKQHLEHYKQEVLKFYQLKTHHHYRIMEQDHQKKGEYKWKA